MNMKECPGCREMVSRNAAACPKCGNPINPKTTAGGLLAKGCLGIIIVGFAMSVCVGSAGIDAVSKARTKAKAAVAESKAKTSTHNASVYKESAANPDTAYFISDYYEENEVKADEAYKGRVVTITGEVNSIKKGILGSMYVTLKGKSMFKGVQCYFDKSKVSQLSNLNKGQQVSITGICDGLMMNVQIKECVLN